MNRRTFETLSKYVAKTHKTTIVFDHPGQGACANPKTGEIHMPANVKDENALAALALLMHEAAHVAHSTHIPERFMKDPMKKDIVNAIEDARIDLKNFNLLNNVKGFYDRMYRDHKKPEGKKIPLPFKLLVNRIYWYEGFNKYKYRDKETREWDKKGSNKHDLDKHFSHGVWAIEQQCWDDLDVAVDEIIKLLGLTKPLSEMAPAELMGQGAIQPMGCKDGESKGQGKGQGKQKDGKDKGNGTDSNRYSAIDVILHPKSILEKGSMDGIRGDMIGDVALQEQTKVRFKELLNIKTKRQACDGDILDTDNLLGYHTGDIEELFKEELTKKEKKSKIKILMDCSGSMHWNLMDGKMRHETLVKCVKAVTGVLDEVIEQEGLNVDYDLAAFDNKYYPLDKAGDWAHEYLSRGGGTNLEHAFKKAITDLADDHDIDGNKIIICLTDGDVCDWQVDEVRESIMTYASDVKAMMIGIGTDPMSHMSEQIVGDNIILAEDNSDLIIMDAIGELL